MPKPQRISSTQVRKKYRPTANRVPACRATSKARPGSCQRASQGNRIRCAVLLTGRKDRKSTRLNSSHGYISYAVFCLKKKKKSKNRNDSCEKIERTRGVDVF